MIVVDRLIYRSIESDRQIDKEVGGREIVGGRSVIGNSLMLVSLNSRAKARGCN